MCIRDSLDGVTAMDDRDLAMEITVDTSKVDLNAIGTYDITYSVTDAAGNTTTAASTVTVTDDNTAPVIQGVHNISLYLGSAVSYRKGVVVTDDKDPSPKLDIDSSQVDLSNPGTYPLVYTARDMTGNETRLEVTVTVAEKPAAFVDEETINTKGIIAIPHLGASTEESEDNCAVMAAKELIDFLETGNIRNSVNYPACDMGICATAGRLTIMHRNVPNALGQFTAAMAEENINIDSLMNKSKGEYAYTMLDLDHTPSAHAVEELKKINGVIRVRVIC